MRDASGNDRELGAEEIDCIAKAPRDPQPLAPAEHNEFGRMRGGGGFHDRIGGAFMGVAEHRKERLSVAMVDRIITPDAARDIAAVEPEELARLGAREVQGAAPASIIPEWQDRRLVADHRPDSSIAAGIAAGVILTISARASSRLTGPRRLLSAPSPATGCRRLAPADSAVCVAPAERIWCRAVIKPVRGVCERHLS